MTESFEDTRKLYEWIGKLENRIQRLESIEKQQPLYLAVKTVDEDVTSSTAVQNDDELFIADVPVGLYAFRASIRYSRGTALSGLKYTWVAVGGGQYGIVRDLDSIIAPDVTFPESLGNPPNTNTNTVSFLGFVAVNAKGYFRFRWAQSTSAVDPITVKRGSYLMLQRMNNY